MYRDLAEAIDRRAWTEALGHALVAWRQSRGEELAALIEELAPLCDPLFPLHELQRRPDWFETLDTAPEDPRVALAALAWVENGRLPWDPERIAGLIGRNGAANLEPRLRRLGERPPGPTAAIRQRQTLTAERTLARLPPARGLDTIGSMLLSELRKRPTLSPEELARIDELWREVARSPHDDGPRLVLADALVQHGDPRGELIALQCAPEQTPKTKHRAERLVYRNVRAWLGDLALVVPLRGLVYRRGMLASTRLGNASTPPWAYALVAGHRELQCLTDLHAHQGPVAVFVDLVHQLARAPLERLGCNTDDLAAEFASRPPPHAIRFLRLSRSAGRHYEQVPLDEQLRHYASALPHVEEIEMWYEARGYERDELISAVSTASTIFPKLRRFRIPGNWVRWAEIDAPPVERGPERY